MSDNKWPLHKLLDLVVREAQSSITIVLKNKNQEVLQIYFDTDIRQNRIRHISRTDDMPIVLGEIQIGEPGIFFGADICNKLNLNPADDSWVIDCGIFRQIDEKQYNLEILRQNLRSAPCEDWRTWDTALIEIGKLEDVLFCAPSYMNRWRHVEFSNGTSKLVMKPTGERYSEVYVTYHKSDTVSKPIEVYFDFCGEWPQTIYDAFGLKPDATDWYVSPNTFRYKEKKNDSTGNNEQTEKEHTSD